MREIAIGAADSQGRKAPVVGNKAEPWNAATRETEANLGGQLESSSEPVVSAEDRRGHSESEGGLLVP